MKTGLQSTGWKRMSKCDRVQMSWNDDWHMSDTCQALAGSFGLVARYQDTHPTLPVTVVVKSLHPDCVINLDYMIICFTFWINSQKKMNFSMIFNMFEMHIWLHMFFSSGCKLLTATVCIFSCLLFIYGGPAVQVGGPRPVWATHNAVPAVGVNINTVKYQNTPSGNASSLYCDL